MYHHDTPFLKSINTSLSSCSLRDGFYKVCFHNYFFEGIYRILEAYFINLIVPSLNQQLDNDVLMLFRDGVT